MIFPALFATQAKGATLVRGAFTVIFPNNAHGAARSALEIANQSLKPLSARLGLTPPKHVTIYLAKKSGQVPAEFKLPPWAAGLAFPFKQILIVRLDRLSLQPNAGLRVVLKHELVHLIMGGAGKRAFSKFPWWFHEGTAQALSSLPFFSNEHDLSALAYSKRLKLLVNLGKGESFTKRAADLAYQEAYSFALFLEDKLGKRVFQGVIAAQKRAKDFNRAFVDATGFSFITMEERWKELLQNTPWATMQRLAGQFFLVLVVLALPLVAMALGKRIKKDQDIEQAWDQEEIAEEEFFSENRAIEDD